MTRVPIWWLQRTFFKPRPVSRRELVIQVGASLLGVTAFGFFCARSIYDDPAFITAAVIWALWSLFWMRQLRRSFLLLWGEVLDAREDEVLRLNEESESDEPI